MIPLDGQEKYMLSNLHEKMINFEINQENICSLLMLLRNHCDRNITEHAPVLEFADFIAHRKRDKGAMKDFMECIQQFALKFIDGQDPEEPQIRPVFTFGEIQRSFNSLLQSLGFPELSPRIVRVIILHIMTVLQHTETFRLKKHGGDSIGHLYFRCYDGCFTLVTHVALTLENKTVTMEFPVIQFPPIYNDDILISESLVYQNNIVFNLVKPHTILANILNIDKKFVITASNV